MEIIKPGDLEVAKQKLTRPYKFECLTCGCIFIANKDEYKDYGQHDGLNCVCPCCEQETCIVIDGSRRQ